ncbi:polysaccharide deacetylase family protein [Corynebacterium sp.]|uniref:polysaccharide deacetylase family protein n=1 Tax=Corynebacterium sp. TaxID=1720 RepID=UPI0026DB51F8|nr:polysaccharide deacetylase family protein [Corynebacterium sp.]MDO5076723.1 polysaccharide deacetylase family protein [Corynebacterium sp.]
MGKRQIIVVVSAVLLLIAAVAAATYFSAPPAGRYKFVDSRYAGVSSKIAGWETDSEKVSIEYPITHISGIDATIEEAIDADYDTFRNEDSAQTFAAGYQITTNTDRYLSIAVNVHQDDRAESYCWTFDKRTGEALTLPSLFDDPALGVSEIVELAQNAARKHLAAQGKSAEDAELSGDRFTNFAVDHGSLMFGSVLPDAYRELNLRVDVNQVSDLIVEEYAEDLFGVTPLTMPGPVEPAVSKSCAGQRCVALTFDDGPGEHTRRLLSILGAHDVKATFYLVGEQVRGNRALTNRMAKAGHQIGNHSWNHPDLSQQSPEVIRQQLVDTNELIAEVTGVTPHTMRPPYGALSPAVTQEIKAAEMSTILWNVDTKDWADLDSTIVCNRAVASAQPGSIILMHDVHKTTVDAVPCVIGELAKLGYRFVTVDELLGETTPGTMYFSAS